MEVELLNQNQSGGILDLTKGAEPIEEEKTEVGEPLPEGEAVLEEQVDTETAGEDDVPESDNTDDAVEPNAVEGEGEFFFGDSQVSVTIPDEIGSALKEAGIDGNDLIKQLFKKDGDFSLDDATRTKLEDKFGKHMVDGYLSMYKGMNEQSLKASAAEKEAQDATFEKQSAAYVEAVGGAEGIKHMEEYIINNLDDNQIKSYNSVMENGDHESQMLVISQLRKTMELQDKLENGDKKLDLIGDKEKPAIAGGYELDKGFITNAEFNKIMEGDAYWTDREYGRKVDAARIAGKRLGK